MCLLSLLLSKVTVASRSFYIRIFNVSALLLDDALLIGLCVITARSRLQLLLLRHYTFHKIV